MICIYSKSNYLIWHLIRFEKMEKNNLFFSCSTSKCLRFVQKMGFLSILTWIMAHVSAKSLTIRTLSTVFSRVNIGPNNWILKSFRILFGLNFDLVQLLAPTFDLNLDLVTKIFEKTFDLVKDKTWVKIFDLTFGLVHILTKIIDLTFGLVHILTKIIDLTFDLVQKLTFDKAYLVLPQRLHI